MLIKFSITPQQATIYNKILSGTISLLDYSFYCIGCAILRDPSYVVSISEFSPSDNTIYTKHLSFLGKKEQSHPCFIKIQNLCLLLFDCFLNCCLVRPLLCSFLVLLLLKVSITHSTSLYSLVV
jgi:hypothetical protein